MKVLLIDDARDECSPQVQRSVDLIARNYWSGKAALMLLGPWDLLLLDHDLHSYDNDGREKTGYDIVLFLEEYPEYKPKEVRIVSSNPVGRARMQKVLDKIYKGEGNGF